MVYLQLRWRMVRQQFAALHNDINSHGSRLVEMQADLTVHKSATSTLSETIRKELMTALSEEMAQQQKYCPEWEFHVPPASYRRQKKRIVH